MILEDAVAKYSELTKQNNTIEPEHYSRYNVKRGLRNQDATGVLVGLTKIGDVHGYIVDENEKIPVEGKLRYRGIEIEDLVKGFQKEDRFGYEETVFLLLFGRLPNATELEDFTTLMGELRPLPLNFKEDVILNLPSNNIMNKLSRSVLAAYSFDPRAEDYSIDNVLKQCIQLIAWFPTIAAYSYQAKRHYFDKKSLYLHRPDSHMGTAENLLRMIRKDRIYSKLEAEVLDLCLVLHAEHGGGNNSAFTIHVVSSAQTDTYSTIAAGIGSLKGARHGGANLKVLQMMEEIKANIPSLTDEDALRSYLAKILKKEAFDGSGLIYGIGHAVYTLSDPRAILLKEKARELAIEKGFEDEFTMYEIIERLAPEVFTELKGASKNMCANVDFYSGFVYRMLNIPSELFTPLFAIARVTGWCAHRIEEIIGENKIMRPAYKNVVARKSYVPLVER